VKRNDHAAVLTIEQLNDLYQNAPRAYVLLGADRRIEACNRRAEELLGRPCEELVGRLLTDMCTDVPVGRPRAVTVLNEIWSGDEVAGPEFEVQTPRGEKVWVGATASPIRGREGGVLGARLMLADLTQRRRDQQALARSGVAIPKLLRRAPERVFVKDRDLNFVYANEAFAADLSTTPEAIVGKSDFDLFTPEGAEKYRAEDMAVIEGRRPATHPTLWNPPDGDRPMVRQWTKIPIRDDEGRVIALVGVGSHPEEQREAAQLVAHWAALTMSSAEAIMGLTRDGIVASWNRGAEEVYGYEADEVKGRPVGLLAAEGAEQELAALVERAAAGQTIRDHDSAHRTRDGRRIEVALTISPVLAADGSCTGLCMVARDVSEPKASERALAESEAKLRAILDSVTDGILLADATTREFLTANPRMCEMLGYSPEELTSLGVADIHPPEDLPQVLENFERQAQGDTTIASDTPMLRKDGSVFHADVNTGALILGGRRCVVGCFRDVTDRRRTEQRLRRSEERLRTLVENMPVLVDAFDEDGNIVMWNSECERVTGYRAEEIVGNPRAFELLYPDEDYRERMLKLWAERGNDYYDWEWQTTCKDGSVRTISWSSVSERYPIPGWASWGVGVDVTERHMLEERLRQTAKMEAIGQLAGGVAHDFNNLLTAILGHAELLKEAAERGDETYEAARTIEHAAQRAAELTERLLGFARRGKHQIVPVDVHATIREVVDLLARAIGKEIRIALDLQADASTVLGDPGQLQQVLMNLGVNARDAMPQGGELVFGTAVADLDAEYCRAHPATSPGRYVMVCVTDTGCGVPEDVRERIFEPFFTTKEPGTGTGMGLAMVYGIVRNHGGSVHVYSELGRGTTFKVYLPLAEHEAGESDESSFLVPEGGTARILLVDDEEAVLDVASAMLERLGYQVKAVEGARRAVEHYRSHPDSVDLVIIDMVMPDMDGQDCFLALKELDPDVRAVLSTGYGMNGRAQAILDEGMVGFIQKPYDLYKLGTAVRSALAR
jgi:PAS domain S-box-containing protein